MGFSSPYDFDFKGDRSNRFIKYIVGFLMYSVTIAIMSGIFTYTLTSGWRKALSGRMTVEFQTNVDGANSAITEKQKEEVIQILKDTNGIKSVRKLNESDILKILEPWLNSTAIPDDFPFPAIFDVEADQDAKIDLLILTDKLSKISSGVRIHDHANWYAPIIKISNGLFAFAIVLSLLIFATVCSSVIFITKKTLMVHHNTVKILQLIGATNSYIASQFKKYYLFIGLKSSAISILCSLMTIFGIVFASSQEILNINALKYTAVSLIVPILTTLLIVITARTTVMFFLKSDKRITQ